MENNCNNSRYGSVDIVKFCMAVCVIAMHTHPLAQLTNQVIVASYTAVVCMAVPFFFLCAGFFMFTEDEERQEAKVVKVMKKYIKLYLVWTCIYLPISIWGHIANDRSVVYSILALMRGFLLVGQNQNSWILWYMLCSIFSVIIFYCFVFKLKKNIFILWGASIMLFLMSLVVSFVYQLNSTNHLWNLAVKALSVFLPEGRMLTGLFYIVTGFLIAKYKILFQKGWLRYLVLFILALLFDISIDGIVINGISVLFSSLFLFLLVINLQIATSKKTVSFREMSTIIYFVHMIVFTLYSQIVANIFVLSGLPSFLVVLTISLIFSIYALRHNENKIFCYIFT